MLRLSKKADYALIAMKHLATRPDGASASAREIAEQYDIPAELMAKVLQRLVRAGLQSFRALKLLFFRNRSLSALAGRQALEHLYKGVRDP
ncbi:MAG: Rrf2 family transcriptional regulator, partial [Acidobacteria bacterium]|nr:Rrf2 family transcriptional regulator [Acidobacteriota bacterium]